MKKYCQILVSGNRAYLSGDYPLKIVKETTSYPVDGYFFSKLFKKGVWDGRKHLFDHQTQSFPFGLVDDVVTAIKEYNPDYYIQVTNKRTRPIHQENGFELHGIEFGKGKYDYQLAAVQVAIEKGHGIFKMATNSGKSSIFCALTKHFHVKTLFLVSRLELVYQTQRNFSKFLQIPEESIGIVGDSNFTLGDWITIATPATFMSKLSELKDHLNSWDMVLADECHSAGSDTYYEVLNLLPAYFRFSGSGTPLDRSDGGDLRLLAQMGGVIYEVSNRLLVDRGISVQPYLEMIKIDKPIIPPKTPWQTVNTLGVVKNEHLNEKVIEKCIENVEKNLQVLIIVDRIDHGELLSNLLWTKNSKIVHQFINGKEDTDIRNKALVEFTQGKIRVLIATSILDEGVDVPCIDVLILAAGGKAKIRLLQRIGRGLRTGYNKEKLLVIDFANFSHKYLLKHSLRRLKLYKQEDCFNIKASV